MKTICSFATEPRLSKLPIPKVFNRPGELGLVHWESAKTGGRLIAVQLLDKG